MTKPFQHIQTLSWVGYLPWDIPKFNYSLCLRIIYYYFLVCELLSILSSICGIETLEIKITWSDDGHGKDLFSSDAGWFMLDEVLTGEKFVSLKHVILDFSFKMMVGGMASSYYSGRTCPHSVAMERGIIMRSKRQYHSTWWFALPYSFILLPV